MVAVNPVRITGASELARSLAAQKAAVPELIDQVTAKSALMIEAEAKKLAPVRTGRLKNSITTSQAGNGIYEVGPTANYGAFVELGTRRQAPQPYLMPAADKIQPIFEQAIEKAVEKLINL